MLKTKSEHEFVIGFTGTRNGMTREQRVTVSAMLEAFLGTLKMQPTAKKARAVHGDCVGSDKDFDDLCAGLQIPRGIRPCTAPPELRAHCEDRGAKVLAEPVRPMARNRALVEDADVFVACPPNYDRIKSGSGTWATIHFAERAGLEVVIVFPDGTVKPGTRRHGKD